MSTNEKAPGGLLHRRPMSDPIFPKGSKTDGTIQSIPSPATPFFDFSKFPGTPIHGGWFLCLLKPCTTPICRA